MSGKLSRSTGSVDPWQNFFIPDSFTVVGMAPESTSLYVITYNGGNTRALWTYNYTSRTLGTKVYQDSVFDLDNSVLFFKGTAGICGVQYDREYPRQVWFDTLFERIQNEINAIFPSTVNEIIDADTGKTVFLLRSYADTIPVKYSVYDRFRNRLSVIGET